MAAKGACRRVVPCGVCAVAKWFGDVCSFIEDMTDRTLHVMTDFLESIHDVPVRCACRGPLRVSGVTVRRVCFAPGCPQVAARVARRHILTVVERGVVSLLSM